MVVSSPAQRSGVSVAEEEEGAQGDDVSKMCLRDVEWWRRYERADRGVLLVVKKEDKNKDMVCA